MPRRRALERLFAHQEEILSIMRGAEPMLNDPATRDTAGLARARWTLMRALTAYQLFKHREVFDPLIAKATPGEAHRVLRMKRACLDLGEEFRTYVQKWSASDVNAEWAAYKPAASTMIGRIRDHMAQEKQGIETLLKD